MNQKIIVVDDFYDVAHMYHKSFSEEVKEINPQELPEKISHILDGPINIVEGFNVVDNENISNPITANTGCDWIGVIYLTMPADCLMKQGISFYSHKATRLESFPNESEMDIYGLQHMEDIMRTFDVNNRDQWEEYTNLFVRYNRLVLFRANLWHSYGIGFGTELNKSMMYQKILIRNV
jgi:hypothetical protein